MLPLVMPVAHQMLCLNVEREYSDYEPEYSNMMQRTRHDRGVDDAQALHCKK